MKDDTQTNDGVPKTPHNFIRDDTFNFKGDKQARITCTNPGCDKRQVPLEVQKKSIECKGAARLAARAARQAAAASQATYA